MFWIGFHLGNAGQHAQAAGWLERLRRLVDSTDRDPHLAAMVRLADAVNLMQTGRANDALPMFDEVVAAAQAAHDDDLLALAVLGRGGCLHGSWPQLEALAADEAMVFVADLVAPHRRLAYCSDDRPVHGTFDVQRAGEWTRARSAAGATARSRAWCCPTAGLSGAPGRDLPGPRAWTEQPPRPCMSASCRRRTAGSPARLTTGWQAAPAAGTLRPCRALVRGSGARGRRCSQDSGCCGLAQGNPRAGDRRPRAGFGRAADPSNGRPCCSAVVEVALATGDLVAAHCIICRVRRRRRPRRRHPIPDRVGARTPAALVPWPRTTPEQPLPAALPRLRAMAAGRRTVRGSRTRVQVGAAADGHWAMTTLPGWSGCRPYGLRAAGRPLGHRRPGGARRHGGRARAPAQRQGVRGLGPGRARPHQPSDRGEAVPEREDRRPPPQQHLRQARCEQPSCSHGVRLRARAGVTRSPRAG